LPLPTANGQLEPTDTLASSSRAAWEQLYSQHWEWVYRVVRRFGGPGVDVEDAVQDVFVALAPTLDRFEGRAELRTWIYRVCLNVASEHRRRARRRARLSTLAQHLKSWFSDERSPAERLETKDEWILVQSVLGLMSAKKREVFILCELEEVSAEEVATILQVPAATVRTRLHYARKEFVALLAGRGGEREA